MTEFTIDLDDDEAAVAARTMMSNWRGGAPLAYKRIAVQIEAQITPDVPAEPTGGSLDVVVLAMGQSWTKRYEGAWQPINRSFTLDELQSWEYLVEHSPATPKVYPREPSP